MNESTDTTDCTYTTLVGGDAAFIRAVGIPLVEALDATIPADGICRDESEPDDALAINDRPRNDVVAIAGIVGVVLYFGSCITKKILDDIYAVKIQPKVKEILGQADNRLSGANSRKKKMYQFGIRYAEQRVFVLIGVVGETFDEVLGQCHLLTTIHTNAVHWIKDSGRQKPIHLYVVQDGCVNVAPLLFDQLAEAHGYIDKLFPSKPSPMVTEAK